MCCIGESDSNVSMSPESAPAYVALTQVLVACGLLNQQLHLRGGERGRGKFIIRIFLSALIYNSSLEGDTELKFAPFYSSFRALSDDMHFGGNPIFQILAENTGLL